MTDVLVCVKRVAESSSQVQLTADGQAVDGRYVGFTIGVHDSCAVELAVEVAEASGGSATVLSLGPAETADQLRGALALGCGAAVLVEADSNRYGPADVAREIAAVVRAHAEEGRSYDLVLLGNDAADSGDFQVGIRLAHALGRPVVNGAATLGVADSTLTAYVAAADGEETYQVPLPVVATVLEGGVEPRYPTIKGRMAAKKVQVETRGPTAEPGGSGRVRLVLPPPQPSSVEILGEGPEAAAAVVDLLDQLGAGR